MYNKQYQIKLIKLLGTTLAVCFILQPLQVSAAESTILAKSVLKQAGISSLIETRLTQEEYIRIAKEAQGASWGYTTLGIANVESGNLNIRAEASTNAKLVGKLPKNGACEILEITEDGMWANIQSGEVEGYVSTEFLLTGPDAKVRANEIVKTLVVVNADADRKSVV